MGGADRAGHRRGAAAPREPRAGEAERGRGDGAADQQRPRIAVVVLAVPPPTRSGSGAPGCDRADRHDLALAAGGDRQPHRGRHLGETEGEALLEPEGRVEAGQVGREAPRDRANRGADAEHPGIADRARRSAGWTGEQRVEIAVGDERLDLADVAAKEAHASVPRSPPSRFDAQILRDAPQRAMDEHPDRTLRPTEHAGDLRGAELVDEAQDHRLAALAGQSPDGAPRGPRLVAPDRLRPRRRADRPRPSRRSARSGDGARAAARRRPRSGRSGTARPGRSRRPRRPRAGPAPRTGRGSSAPRRTSPRSRPPRA